jgi:heme exporter protein A
MNHETAERSHDAPPDVPAPALVLEGVAKIYGRTAALKATSLRLERGETLVLLGPNGSGKTTLLKIVAGAIAPTLGGGLVFGRDLVAERKALRAWVGLLSTDTYLYDDLSARENLQFSATMSGRTVERGALDHLLDQVGLGRQAATRPREFSSGMKRRLALARTLLMAPRLLLLDEPYNSLDEEGVMLVEESIRRLVADGGAAILATHDTERALRLANKVAVLQQGSLVYLGSPQDYAAGDQAPKVFSPARIGTRSQFSGGGSGQL